MMIRFVTLVLGALLGVAVTAAPAVSAQTERPPTFNKDVAPILFRSCAGCHRPNQIAPMPLLSYQDARPWARAIKVKVQAREMPPWFTDPRFNKYTFENDNSLTEAEINTIVAWVDAGAPQGDGQASPVPQFAEAGWSHPSRQPPDLVIELPFDYQVAAQGEMPNFTLYSPLPFNESRLVAATQVLPGNMAATHHIGMDIGNLPPGTVLGSGRPWPGAPLTPYMAVPAQDGAAATAVGEPLIDPADADARRNAAGGAGNFAVYVPGLGASVLPPRHARPVRGDQMRYVRWGLHYQPTGQPETARPKLGIWWEKSGQAVNVQRLLSISEQTSEGQPVLTRPRPVADKRESQGASFINPFLAPIPPHDGSWTVTGVAAFQDDVTIHEIFLHMHARGKHVTYVLTYPDGREEVLFRVQNYSFDWQLPYKFAQPLKVPAGTTLKAVTVYDNSAKNRMNPAPYKEVYWSEQSWDDMFLTNVRYSVDRLEKGSATRSQGQN